MRLFLAVIGVCLVMWGCDKKAKDQTQGMADVEIWKGLYAREKADKEKLQSSFDAERAANANLEKKLQPVQDQADRLKIQLLTERTAAAREIARLKSELGGAKSAAIALADLAESGTSAKSPVNGKPAPASATDIANAEKAIADLEDRLAELQGKVGLARNKVANFQKAPVSVPLSPPDGHGSDKYHYWGYTSGDFSSEFHKQEAIREARGELVPLEIEFKKTQDALAKAKLNLAKMKATGKIK